MRQYLSPMVIAIALVTGPTPALRGQCSDCPTPHIALFDCRVLVQEPVVRDSISFVAWKNWVRLYQIAGHIAEQLEEGDPKSSCVAYFDGAFVSQNTTDPESLQVSAGVTWANLPPDGPLPGWGTNYLFVGEISPAGNGYVLELRLETGISRELVKSVKVPFDSARGGYLAGIAAATLMIPVIDEIQKFEKDKRDSDTKYAVQADLTLTPAKKKVATGEGVSIALKLEDCDRNEGKVPLKQRQIQLWGEGGTVDPPLAKTDDSGKTTVTFIAGSNPGVGIIHATYPYWHPDGRYDAVMNEESVVIQSIPTGILFAQASAFLTTTVHAETSTSSYMLCWERKTHTTEVQSLHVTAWLPNESGDPDYYLGGIDAQPVAKSTHGTYSKVTFLKIGDYAQGQLAQGKEQLSYWDGSVTADHGWIQFEFTGDSGGIGINVGYDGILATHLKTYKNFGWSVSGSSSPFKDFTASVRADNLEGGSATVTHTGRMYVVTASLDTTYRESDSEIGTVVTSVVGFLYGIVRPAEDVTEVDLPARGLLPQRFALLQNYPNPFNPTTTITYELPKSSMVRLSVYDILGREVSVLVNEQKNAGVHEVRFDAGEMSSGMYFYRLQTAEFVQARSLIVLK